MRSSTRATVPLYAAIVTTMVVVGMVDFLTPRGFTTWTLYFVALALAVPTRRADLPIVLACATTLLTGATLASDPEGYIPYWLSVVDRALFLVSEWVLAVVVRRAILDRLGVEREQRLRVAKSHVVDALPESATVADAALALLGALSSEISVPAGVVYVSDDEGVLVRAATLGLSVDVVPVRLQIGERLTGEAAKATTTVVWTDIPSGHLPIRSATGESAPSHLLLRSLRVGREIVGVVELALLGPVDPIDVELLDRLSEPCARALRAAVDRERLLQLLDRTQTQATELQAQEEELRSQNEELEEHARTLTEAQQQLEAQQAELEQSNETLETRTEDLARRAEELAAARVAAEDANRLKSEFLATMSHELRTPLTTILLVAQVLANDRHRQFSQEAMKHGRAIYDAGQDLLTLVNEVLDLAKIEAGHVEQRVELVPIERVVDAARRVFEPLAHEKGLSFVCEVKPDAPHALCTDPQRLQQIVRNLLSNAVKFTDQGDVRLTISSAPGDRVAFAVSDTGIGVPESLRKIIFEPFRQADSTARRRYGGTGLGLSIAMRFALLLGGEITVDSTVGEGSTFTLLLPRRPAEAPSPEPPATDSGSAEAPEPRSSRRIVLVENDLRFGEVLAALVRELGFEVDLVRDADDALARASERPPPVGVLLDTTLPGGSGLDLLARLKRHPATRAIPVHVLASEDDREAALQLGAVGHAVKPVAREDIVRSLQALEARNRQQVRHVLLVEGDDEQRASTAEMLSVRGVEVTAVASVEDTIARLAERSWDCMVLGLKLTDGTAYDVLEAASSSVRASFPPVIVYSGRPLTADEEERLRRHARTVVVKGARSPERLLDEVTLFLHHVETELPPDRRRMLRDLRTSSTPFEGRRLLIVDDDTRTSSALAAVFEQHGATVETARNGREGLERLEREPKVDLVLMDVMMPELDGYAAMREIRRRPALARLPVLALTAHAMPEDEKRCLEAGANDYLSKPVDLDRLIALARIWMRR